MPSKGTTGTRRKTGGTPETSVAHRRAERQEATRRRILDAAARVIGKHGYAGCSVGKVTAKARMAHGTFYLYFKSQQQLFESILPVLGGEMLSSIAAAVGTESDPMAIERAGFTANIAYTASHPYMNRVLYEAQHFAPKAYAKWLGDLTEGYVRSLKRSLVRGPFAEATDDQLLMVAMMLVNARTALLFRIDSKTGAQDAFVKDTVDTYLKFVAHGLGI